MKKDVKSICLITFLFVFLCLTINTARAINVTGGITGKSVTGETVTGEATKPISMNITVIVSVPTLSISSPKNKTYLTNNSLLFGFTKSGEQAAWYNLDNSENITVTSSLYFDTSEGSHTLYLYANNSQGTIASQNVTFSVNTTKFIMLYEEYKGSRKGRSTNFYDYSYEELQSLSSVILENTLAGRITFSQAINLTNDENPNNTILDLDSNTNISFNRIELNSTALPNLNKPATLRLYGLSFSNPRILKNGQVCPSDECVKQSYSFGILVFNVANFTIYSAEETPEEALATTSRGSSAREEIPGEISLDKDKIKIKLKQGETKKEEITIKNEGNRRRKINLAFSGLEEFIKTNKTSFELSAGESEKIIFDVTAGENTIPDLYLGKLTVESESIKKEVLISVEVETKKPVIVVSLEIPKEFQVVAPGAEILAKISLYNLEGIKGVDAVIEYLIKDEGGNITASEKETLAVETLTNFTRTIQIPENASDGTYILYVKATYDKETAIASAMFSVKGVEKPFITKRRIYWIVMIILLIAVLVFLLIELKRIKKLYKKLHENK